MTKVLLAEDERELARAETAILQINDFEVDNAYDGEAAEAMVLGGAYDVIVLDIMMPKKDGIAVLKAIRGAGCTTPVIMLTAKAELDDRITGLDAGADDYLAKPFAMKELIARIRSQLRRASDFTPQTLTFADLTLNIADGELRGALGTMRLSAKETKLLAYLMQNPARQLSTEHLLNHVWQGEDNAALVHFYIAYLREKLKAVGSAVTIPGEKGGSYALVAEVPHD